MSTTKTVDRQEQLMAKIAQESADYQRDSWTNAANRLTSGLRVDLQRYYLANPMTLKELIQNRLQQGGYFDQTVNIYFEAVPEGAEVLSTVILGKPIKAYTMTVVWAQGLLKIFLQEHRE